MKRLLDAPHRIFFFAAAVQILIVSAWWAATLAARAAGAPPALPSGLEPARVHALVMTYGFFPLFIFGFLFTAGPRWLEQPAPARRQYAAPALVAAFAAWLLLPAAAASPGLAALDILVMLGAWGWMLGHFIQLIRTSRAPDRLHAILVACALGLGLVGLAAARVWILTGSARAGDAMETIGMWGFLVPVVVTVSHRMIPFFTANVVPRLVPWRPAWTLGALAGGAVSHGALVLAGLAQWTWFIDAPVGAMALFAAWRWGFARSFANRMLAMLHLGFLWLGVAWLLHALQSALAAAGAGSLGLAPTHALAIGFLSSVTFAMVSRVSCGHSGRTLAADRLTWVAFLTLQAAAATRVAADLWTGAYSALLVAAASLWLACFAAWTWRYLPFYWRPRADGKPG
ncbi:MAG TPA: NnrS family protein [Usitatibacter sp.]|jgi:uncharacterized protein involved in response to NO|nr:NnrS family protein [Usitatibacter sp.]